MTTLTALAAPALPANSAAVGPLLAAAACTVAKPVATRRADTATRALRSALGLHLARLLRRPLTISLWWLPSVFGSWPAAPCP